MAGGQGTRFWPISRSTRPKPLLKFLDSKSLIKTTVDRIAPLVGADHILIVTVSEQFRALRREIKSVPSRNFILEPYGRNTAPCIGLAATELISRDAQAIMIVLPADHWISDPGSFRRTLAACCKIVDRTHRLLTIGIKPRYPETGYGYIIKGKAVRGDNRLGAHSVKAFKEKPSLKTAQRLIRTGSLWNSGVFVWEAATILSMIKTYTPGIYRSLNGIQSKIGAKHLTSTAAEVRNILQREYKKMPDLSIDQGVLQKASSAAKVITVQGKFAWSDIGSWTSLHQLLPHDRQGNAALGQWLGIDSSGCLVHGGDRLVVLLGMRDTMVVDTRDAILVGDLNRVQEMRRVVKELELSGHGKLLREFSR